MSIPEFKFTGTPLNNEAMGMVSGFLLNKEKERPLDGDELIQDEFSTKMVLKRFKAYDLKFKISSFFLVSSLMTFADNPGKIMIMLWLAFQYHKNTGKDFLGIEDWCEIFPHGTPTDEELKIMWDSQKDIDESAGNMLDNSKFWV